MTAAPVDDKLHAVLRDLRGRFGDGLLDDRRRLVSLLGDHVPEARREIRLIGLSLDDGVPAELRRLPPDQVPLQLPRLATRLESHYGIRPDFARWVIAFWLRVLAIAAPAGFETPAGLAGEGESRTDPVPAAPLAEPAPIPAVVGGLLERIGLKGIAAAALVLAAVTGAGVWLGAGGPPAPAMQVSPQAAPAPAIAQAPTPAAVETPAEAAPLPETFATLAPGQGSATPEAPVTYAPGRALTARFTVPGSPIRYTVTLRPEERRAEWLAVDPTGRRSQGAGSLDRVADASGNDWDWSRAAWSAQNGLGLKPLCLAAFAGRAGARDPGGGLVCLYDESCAAAYGCFRMRTR